MSITLYGRGSSYNVQKVLWLLDELELEFKHLEYGGRFGGLDNEQFAELNPLKKVPVLVDDNRSVWESNTILRYLAASYGSANWYSDSPFERSVYERWMDWSVDKMEQAFVGVFWGYYRMPASKRDMQKVHEHVEEYNSCLDTLNKALSAHRYVSGETISLADICLGVFIFRLQDIGLAIELPKHVDRWYGSLKSRPPYIAQVMTDFSELKGRESY